MALKLAVENIIWMSTKFVDQIKVIPKFSYIDYLLSNVQESMSVSQIDIV